MNLPPGAERTDAERGAEETIRAISAGQVDAFVVADEVAGHQVFTLSTADRPYRMFVEHMRDGAATLSAAGRILYANRRLVELLGQTWDAVVGQPLATFLAGGAPIDAGTLLGPEGRGATFETDLCALDTTAVPVLVGTAPLEVDGIVVTCMTFTDLSAQKVQDREIVRLGVAQATQLAVLQEAQASLTRQATHDALTDLPNRALLLDRIDQSLARGERSGDLTAVLFLDLDQFKQVNDAWGHAAGDALLRRVASVLTATLRPMDTVARIGGDEFVVLLPEVDSDLHAVGVATRLIAELRRRPEDGDGGRRITASIGLSVSVGGRGTAEGLLNEADAAMYHAKSMGGGRVEVFDARLGRQVEERGRTQEVLQAALDDRRVTAHYQPIVDLDRGGVVAFEALARINTVDGATLSPAAFIPVAEDSGLIVTLGEQILAAAIGEACRWRPSGPSVAAPNVSVNLSARQLEPGDLPAVVAARLEVSGLAANRLHLELTETAIMDLRPDVVHQLGALRDLGVEIGLDDFGTGYASLTHLRRLPISFVKIDQSFVGGLGLVQDDEGIVAAVIDLAANLRLRSIAEGVETPGQLERLRALGCDEAQGYLLARPMPAGEVAGALRDAPWDALL